MLKKILMKITNKKYQKEYDKKMYETITGMQNQSSNQIIFKMLISVLATDCITNSKGMVMWCIIELCVLSTNLLRLTGADSCSCIWLTREDCFS